MVAGGPQLSSWLTYSALVACVARRRKPVRAPIGSEGEEGAPSKASTRALADAVHKIEVVLPGGGLRLAERIAIGTVAD